MSELGLAEYFTMEEAAIGIIATLFVILYFFSRKQMQSLSVDIQTKVLNDLNEKFHRMAEIAMADPSIHKMIDAHSPIESHGVSAKEMAFSFYILWLCAHAHEMLQRKVLDHNEWAGWLHWMRNCFQRGTI
jgi:hypothetical protein